MRKFLFCLFILVSSFASAQAKEDTLICKGLEVTLLRATVDNFGFFYGETLYISKDSLKNGFTVKLSDPAYKIIGFTLFYDWEGCDVWAQDVYGDSVTPKNVSILKRLKKGEILEVYCLNLELKGKRYTAPGIIIAVID